MKKILAAAGIGAALFAGSLGLAGAANAYPAPHWGDNPHTDATFVSATCNQLHAQQGHLTTGLVANMVNQHLTIFGGDYLERGYPAAKSSCPQNGKALDYAIDLLR